MDLLRSRIGDYRHEDLLGYCTRLAENVGGLADALVEWEAAEELVRCINWKYDNEETRRE